MFRGLAALTVLGLGLSASLAPAASLTGDNSVSFRIIGTNGSDYGFNAAVGSGFDASLFALTVDFDAGLARDIFSIQCCVGSGGFGYGDAQSSTTINLILSDLDFDQPFVGVTFFSNIVNAQVSAITARSITLTWQDGAFFSGEHLSFRFDSAPVSQVPLPAALPMLALGLGGLALLGRRRRV